MPPDLLANSCLWYSAPTFGDRILPRRGGGRRERALCQFCPTTEESLKNALGCSKHDHSVNPSLTEGCNRALINTPFSFVYFCTSVYFKTSENKTCIDPGTIFGNIFLSL
jgi:hypothetical protein